MNDPKLSVAASIMGQALAGISMQGGKDLGADFEIDATESRVWAREARVTLDSGDMYEISTRWVSEDSP